MTVLDPALEKVVDEAIEAFRADLSYTTEMCRAASTITSKRNVWAVRARVRSAEASARARCAADDFICQSGSPCGFGECRYADEEDRAVDVVSLHGDTPRVQERAVWPTYDRESVVRALRDG